MYKRQGLHKLPVELHGEVEVGIIVNVARNEDEAARQARGEDLTITRSDEEEERAQARVDAGKFFEAPEGESEDGEVAPAEEAGAEPKTKPKRAKKAAAEDDAADAKPAGEKEKKKPKKAVKE